MVGWSLLADSVPLYPLYALMFADAGLSAPQLSALFVVWSIAGVVGEVPAGILADRWSRRGCLSAAGIGQATGYAIWVMWPSFGGFAMGFALWGLSGALVSGALEALLYDGLAACGAEGAFTRSYGRVSAAALVGQLPAAAAASVLFPLGGFRLVGWASIACCLTAALAAMRLPLAERVVSVGEPEPALRAGWRAIRADVLLRLCVVVLAAVTGLDAVEEYFPLVVHAFGVPTAGVPAVALAIPIAGAAGAWWAGRVTNPGVAALLVASTGLFAAGVLLGRPVAVGALAAAYALYRGSVVVLQAKLQHRLTASARATVTSLAALTAEVPVLAVYAAWAAGGMTAFCLLMLGVTLAVWRLERRHPAQLGRPNG